MILDFVEIVLLSGLGVCFLIQIIFYMVYFFKPVRCAKKNKRNPVAEAPQEGVSVIICAKNESDNLLRFLPSVLEQDYPKYEVIVVNDGSTDESDIILGEFEKKYKHLYCTYIPEQAKYISRKKLAVTVGIKASKYERLLFTEANCEPVSSYWISHMARNFDDKTDIVLGINSLSRSLGFWSKLATFDNLITTLQYLSLALFKSPYKGVGRNLAYRKSLFFTMRGFSKYLNLNTGEDDLFVNQMANRNNTKVELSSDSQMVTQMDSLGIWKEMKLIQATTQRYYRSGPVACWRFEKVSKFLFYAFLLASVLYGIPELLLPVVAGSLFLIRLIIQLIVINKTSAWLAIEKFYWTLPLFDILLPFVDLYFYVSRFFKDRRDYTWK